RARKASRHRKTSRSAHGHPLGQPAFRKTTRPKYNAEPPPSAYEAKALVNGHAVELWDGLRFIDHFPTLD
ncbi:hypothetical protein, partial [Methylobacterium sp. WL103]|uniref:hypothetical protein n=1 Tax=Methylobacterium sp. WL103 TaxID=2603891 RepID=UPI001AEEF43B